jgi:hypothetical protein
MRRVLLVHTTPHPHAARLTTRQHLRALARATDVELLAYNAVHGVPRWLGRLDFDAVVLHTTSLCMRWSVWFEPWRRRSEWLGELDCLKIALPQDEYHHAERLDAWLDDLGVTVVCTVLDDRHRSELYPTLSSRAAFYDVLTGYIDDDEAERMRARLVPAAERPYDLVYRARNLPYWLGSHGQLKHRIGEAAAAQAAEHGLTHDITTRPQGTVLGDAWLDFLGSGRATVGAESGSSTLDRRGELAAATADLLEANPGLTFEEFAAQMPAGWDDYRFFALSPRHLEAVVTQTAQILVEGRYSGVLEADRHFIPVRSDLSNLDDALEQLKDSERLRGLVEGAYEDIYLSGRFSTARLTETLERVLDEHAPRPEVKGGMFRLASRAADAESEVERVVVGPFLYLARFGRAGGREVLAGLRLAATDSRVRRLLLDYARSTETRANVGPRSALLDLICLGTIRRARPGRDGQGSFDVTVDVDREARRVVVESRATATPERPDLALASREELEQLLRSGGWEFLWDHSRVGDSIEYPISGSQTLQLPLPDGPRPLPVLNWLARSNPGHVAGALSRAARLR